jgi:hypothetical protein
MPTSPSAAPCILAARIAVQASGGEMLISSILKHLTESVGDLRFGESRPPEPHQVVQVRW